MSPNTLYQTLVEALESQLPPRVVSLLLREGMAQGGATPETVTMATVEAVLRGPVFRQLQTSGRKTATARDLVSELEAYVRAASEKEHLAAASSGASDPQLSGPPRTDGAEDQQARAALSELQTALRPFNLYFSWPEVRKLRSLVQVAEDEFARGGNAAVVVTEAEAQLQLVQQKLEDQLVLQARTLADLESVLETVSPLGTPGVRRLDALIATVREAQDRRTLVEAETERAEKLARELRKLVESTVLDERDGLPDLGRGDGRPRAPALVPVEGRGAPEGAPSDDGKHASPTAAGAEVAADLIPADGPTADRAPHDGAAADARDRLHALDLEGEARDLDALVARHAELLRHEPALADAVSLLRAELQSGRVLAERLTNLEREWATQTEARRQALRAEFEAIRIETEELGPDVDTVDLRHALVVALDLLEQTLPTVEDIATVREFHATALSQGERQERERRERSLRREEQQAQIAAVHDRLDTAWRDSEDDARLRRARERLWPTLAALHEAAIAEKTDAALLETALDAEAAWQRAVAEASDDEAVRRQALVRAMSARVTQLPDIPSLRARTTAVRAEVMALDADGVVDDARLQALTHLVEQLSSDARAAVAKRIDEIAREAEEPAPAALLRALQAAARQFDEGGFPDLDEVEREVAVTHDVRRAALRRRYLRVRQEAQRLAEAGVPSAAGLMAGVGAAREAMESDEGAAEAIGTLEARIGRIEAEVAARLKGFEARLQAALDAFRAVSRLNNDDVAAVRRVLTHLDDQRAAVGRVSPGLQAQLFASLTDAENTLRHLEAAFEATRAVADQLVSGGRLDDVLSAFDNLFDSPAPEDPVPRGVTAPSPPDEVAAWLDGYLASDDVAGAVLLSPAGQLLAGRAPANVDVGAVGAALAATLGAWSALGERMGDAAPDIALIDIAGKPTWMASLDDQGCALVWSHRGTTGTSLGARLRDDRLALLGLLRSRQLPAPPASPPNAGTPEG